MLKYKDFSMIRPDAFQCQRIDDIIIKHNGSVFHETALNRIIENNFNSELFYLVDDPQNINNFSPVHIQKNKFGLKRYHLKPMGDIPYAGFVNADQIAPTQLKTGFLESINYSGFPKKDKENDSIVTMEYGETVFVDLSLEEDYIFNNIIHSKRRNMIRKAIKSGIIIEKYLSIKGLDIFWPILNQLHEKLGYTDLTYDYYKSIFETYSVKNQAFVLIAFKEGKPVSGVFVLGNLNYMHYYKGASVFGIKNEGQGELLQWEAIKYAKELGAKYYDLCNIESEKLPAIYKFKTGISKDIYRFKKYSNSRLGYKAINRIGKAL